MTEILLSHVAQIALDATVRLKAGTLGDHQREGVFWDRTTVPNKIVLGEIGPRRGWPPTSEWRFYSRIVEVWGVVGRKSKRLARFEMLASVSQRLKTEPDDNSDWGIWTVYYLGLKQTEDGSWKEEEHYLDFTPPIISRR